MILVTGGAGFIGSNFVLDWLAQDSEAIVNLDLLTYAGNMENLQSLEGDPRHIFVCAYWNALSQADRTGIKRFDTSPRTV